MSIKGPYGFPFQGNSDDAIKYCAGCKSRLQKRLTQLRECHKSGKIDDLCWITPIKDPVFGYIKLIPEAQILLDTCYMQRLRRIMHLSFVYLAYPSAMHSRFEHSLGVYQIATKILENKYLQRKVDAIDKFKVQIAALLHDVGQGPFSHLSDMMANILPHKMEIKHERFSHWLINPSYIDDESKLEYCDSRLCLAKIIHDIFEIAFPDKSPCERRDIRYQISWMIDETENIKEKDPIGLRHIISNKSLDADKLDYQIRDAYESGSSFAQKIDIDRICDSIDVDDKKGITISENIYGSVLQLLFTRSLAYVELYYHKVNRIASEMILKAFQQVYLMNPKVIDTDLIALRPQGDYVAPLFYRWDDFHFLFYLVHCEIPELRKVALDVLNRNLFKQCIGLSFNGKDGEPNLAGHADMRRELEGFLATQLRQNPDDLLAYCFKSPSAGFNKGLENVNVRATTDVSQPLASLVPYKAVNPAEYLLYICSNENVRTQIDMLKLFNAAKQYLVSKGVDEQQIKLLLTWSR